MINEHIRCWNKQWLYVEHLYSKYASEYHLTMAAMNALDRIYHDQVCSQKYLCLVLSMPKQTVSSFMRNLENQELVVKDMCKADRRLCEYRLTETGTKLCEKIFSRLDKIEYNAFRSLSKEDREAFTRINAQLTQLIKAGMEEEHHGS